jgi:hypothetical protein
MTKTLRFWRTPFLVPRMRGEVSLWEPPASRMWREHKKQAGDIRYVFSPEFEESWSKSEQPEWNLTSAAVNMDVLKLEAMEQECNESSRQVEPPRASLCSS